MCLSCGCGVADDDHGDPRNITLADLRSAAEAANITMLQLSVNLDQGITIQTPEEEELARDVESMNHPLPSGQLSGRLESTPYEE